MVASLPEAKVEVLVGYARMLFEPIQQPLPEQLAQALSDAVRAWEGGEAGLARTLLRRVFGTLTPGYI